MKLRSGVFFAEVDYGAALLDEDTGQYWNLNPTGVLILETMLGGATADEAAQALAGEYDVEPATATRDVESLVKELSSAGLIEGAHDRKAGRLTYGSRKATARERGR